MSVHRYEFFIPGIPVTQGSMRVVKGNVIHVKSAQLKQWRRKIAIQARALIGQPVAKQTPISMEYKFYMPRGKTVTRHWPSVQPDLDKLVRAVNDALEQDARIIPNDGCIIELKAAKYYADRPNKPGVYIHIQVGQPY